MIVRAPKAPTAGTAGAEYSGEAAHPRRRRGAENR